jgi:chaperonin GroEL
MDQGSSLLIITEHVHEQSLRKLESIVLSNNVNLCIIKTPGFGPHRKDLIRDLSDFTGATVISDMTKEYNDKILGTLKSASISKNSSILVKDENINLEDLILTLKEYSKSTELTDYDKELLKQRIDNLTGKVSIIKVGGKTENEMKERYDRYDDAVKAVACALEEGIVQGGGIALYNTNQIVAKTIKNLKHQSVELAVFTSLNKPNDILNVPVLNNMFELNIIDPLKVTRTALENAVSVAKTILSTDAIVLNEIEWNKN